MIYSSDNEAPAPLYILLSIASGVVILVLVTNPIVIMRNRDIREIIGEIMVHGCSQADNKSQRRGTELYQLGMKIEIRL